MNTVGGRIFVAAIVAVVVLVVLFVLYENACGDSRRTEDLFGDHAYIAEECSGSFLTWIGAQF